MFKALDDVTVDDWRVTNSVLDIRSMNMGGRDHTSHKRYPNDFKSVKLDFLAFFPLDFWAERL